MRVIAGGKDWFDIREYILGHHDWFKRNGMFQNGIPADEMIAHIVSRIEPEPFNAWISAMHSLTDGQVIAMDEEASLRLLQP